MSKEKELVVALLTEKLKRLTNKNVVLVERKKKNKNIQTGLTKHPDLVAKIKEKGLPDGFSMGKDKDGYFIYTHRARSKSHEKPGSITVKEIRFIDSTG